MEELKTRIESLRARADKLPRHVAIIMDGNGRWAQDRGLPRWEGHHEGAKTVEPVLDLCHDLGVNTITLFAFSTENWKRPRREVEAIMSLLEKYIDTQTPRLRARNICLRFLGAPEQLSDSLRNKMDRATRETSAGSTATLNICINYGGRDEILAAVRKLLLDSPAAGISPESLTEETFSKYLDTAGLPYPDLLIRTGGDHRISNFLLWQIAYAEIIFHQNLWPDFKPADMLDCLEEYLDRDRRFGGLGATGAPQSILARMTGAEVLKKLPEKELEKLASEMREVIIESVSRHGGHLASNLGVVELTIALHRVFETPRDRIVWDVGHQCYPHKLLTGRYKDFSRLRRPDGISGFPKRSESAHDCFDTGHGSTSVSAALGLAAARDLDHRPGHVIAVCGDGALSGGMLLEALNHAGSLDAGLIVVLNDNEFSISPSTGSLSRYLNKIRTNVRYVSLTQRLHDLSMKGSIPARLLRALTKPARNLAKYFVFRKGIIFEELGFRYVGPVDGHNLRRLLELFENIKKLDGPILVHVVTRKGKGYDPAEQDPTAFHGVKGSLGDEAPDIAPRPDFTKVFSKTLEALAAIDPRIVGVTAAMPTGTGMEALIKKHPDRFFDVGMAEEHAVTFAAGLAAGGKRPVVAIYSTFLQRAYDQILHDVCLQNLPVVFCLDRAGFVDRYGPTHQGIFDLAFLRSMPNIQVLAPADTEELPAMLEYALAQSGPVAIRYPAGRDLGSRPGRKPPAPVRTGKSELLLEGGDMVIWALGPMVFKALKAARLLRDRGVYARVLNPRFIKPLDAQALTEAYNHGIRRLVTIEEGIKDGGFGGAVLEKINELGLSGLEVLRLGIDSASVPEDVRPALIEVFGLSGEAIAESILRRWRLAQNEQGAGSQSGS